MTLRRKAALVSGVAHRGANGRMGEIKRKSWCRRKIYTKAIDVSSRSDEGSQVGAEFNAGEPEMWCKMNNDTLEGELYNRGECKS